MSKKDSDDSKMKKNDGGKFMGPLGLGDPNDKSISDVENDIYLRPYFMRMAQEQCKEEDDRRNRCMAKYGIAGIAMCRQYGRALGTCMDKWQNDPKLIQDGTEKFLQRRTEYRLKGDKIEKLDDKVKTIDLPKRKTREELIA